MTIRAGSTFAFGFLALAWFSGCGPRKVCDWQGGCFDCAGPVVTCSYGGVEVTEISCRGCQARIGLYQALCDAGSEVPLEEVEAGMVCDDTDADTR